MLEHFLLRPSARIPSSCPLHQSPERCASKKDKPYLLGTLCTVCRSPTRATLMGQATSARRNRSGPEHFPFLRSLEVVGLRSGRISLHSFPERILTHAHCATILSPLSMHVHPLDLAIVVAYLLGVTGLGMCFRSKKRQL